jgi:hypothetical protein
MLKKYEIAAAAEAVYEIILSTEGCRRNWQFALYYAILKSTSEEIEIPIWKSKGEMYRGKIWDHASQWNYDHEFRNNLKSKNKIGLICTIDNISNAGNGQSTVSFQITFQHITRNNGWSQNIKLTRNDFIELCKPDDTVRQILYDDEVSEILTSISENGNIVEAEEIQGLSSKFGTLFKLIPGLQEVYSIHDGINSISRDYIETIVGAALFYLPHPVNECFNGYCSMKSLNYRIKRKKTVKEHIYPRKRAGYNILNSEIHDLRMFINDFKVTFSEFMYLTSDENSDTINFEGNHDDALRDNHIVKFPDIDPSPFYHNHKRFLSFIRYCRNSKGETEVDITLQEATGLLNSFMNNNNKRFKLE